jgi:hypothetical protein
MIKGQQPAVVPLQRTDRDTPLGRGAHFHHAILGSLHELKQSSSLWQIGDQQHLHVVPAALNEVSLYPLTRAPQLLLFTVERLLEFLQIDLRLGRE